MFNIENRVNETETVVFNTFTQNLISLDKSTVFQYFSLDNNIEYAQSFINMGYWVREEENEIEKIIFNNQEGIHNNDTIVLIIKLTNDCNFRCPYCYQNHTDKIMTNETLAIVKKYLLKSKEKQNLKIMINYFGGEPLLCLETIADLQVFLNENKFDYKSYVTTNGYLLTPEVLDKLFEVGISSYIITIDGVPEIHNKTRILADGSGSFNIIINNLVYALNQTNLKIIVRCNINKKKENYIGDFFKLLKTMKILHKVQLFFNETFDHNGCGDLETYYSTRKEYANVLLNIQKMKLEYGLKVSRIGRKDTSCALDNVKTLVVDPELNIESCTSDCTTIGYINNNGDIIPNNNYYKKYNTVNYNNKECLTCNVLPMCMGGCSLIKAQGKCGCIPERYIIQELIALYAKSTKMFGSDGL